jgi:hypothetical protein
MPDGTLSRFWTERASSNEEVSRTSPKWRVRGLVAKAAVVILGGTPLAVIATTTGAGANSDSPSYMKIVTSGESTTRLSQHMIKGGDATESWKVGNATVTVSGPPGSTVSVSSTGSPGAAGSVQASVTLPGNDKYGANAAQRALIRYATSGRSVYSEALAVGYSASEASQVRTNLTSSPQSPALSAVAASSIIGSACASVKGDGNQAYGKACIIQTLMQAKGYDWYIGDEITSSAGNSDFWWGLTGLQAWDTYGPNNTIVRWNPSSTQYPSACGNVTFGLTYNGAGISATDTLCPDRLDPKFFGSGGYGTNWTGCARQNQVVGAPSVDLDHNPPNASYSVTIHVYIWWNCFL